jgi:hypothetical protein
VLQQNNRKHQQHITTPKRTTQHSNKFNTKSNTDTAYLKQSVGTAHLCPYCTTERKDQHHFLSGTHPHQQEAWDKAANQTTIRLQQYNTTVHYQLIKLIKLAITTWRTTSTPPIAKFL